MCRSNFRGHQILLAIAHERRVICPATHAPSQNRDAVGCDETFSRGRTKAMRVAAFFVPEVLIPHA